MTSVVALDDIRHSQKAMAGTAIRTPLVRSETLSRLAGTEIYLKLETLQPTGSFKVRGVANKVSRLTDEDRRAGLVTVSSGNHGRALAWISQRMNVNATICLYETVPQHKVDAIKHLGGKIEICGKTYEEAEIGARSLMKERGLTWCDPFDDPAVIAGQGVIGLEIAEDLPNVGMVIVPLSGGGLFSGIASAVKSSCPGASLVGVANQHGNGMLASLEAGRPVPIDEHASLADCMAGTISPQNRFTFGITKGLIDQAVTVGEHEIAPAIRHCCMEEGIVTEGGAALPVATLLGHHVAVPSRQPVVLVISGRNIDTDTLAEILPV